MYHIWIHWSRAGELLVLPKLHCPSFGPPELAAAAAALPRDGASAAAAAGPGRATWSLWDHPTDVERGSEGSEGWSTGSWAQIFDTDSRYSIYTCSYRGVIMYWIVLVCLFGSGENMDIARCQNGNIIEQCIVCLLQYDNAHNVIINHQSLPEFNVWFWNIFCQQFLINVWNVSELVAYSFPDLFHIGTLYNLIRFPAYSLLTIRHCSSRRGQLNHMVSPFFGWFFSSPSAQEVLCCAWLLWRLHGALGPSARELVRELVDDARFEGLTLQRKKLPLWCWVVVWL